jgi:serine/threonine-protein kinase
MSEAVSAGAAGGGALGPGVVLGGRFELVAQASSDAVGATWKARDQKTKKGVALRIPAPTHFVTPEALELLRAEVKIATTLVHKNLAGTFGMGVEKSGVRFVACEAVDGKTVAELRTGERMSLAQIVDVIVQLCDGLGAIHQKHGAAHGGLRPSVVWVAGGKVKIADVGTTRALLRSGGPGAIGEAEQAYLAPEVRASGHAASVASDVFGVGGVLYALSTGRLPTDEFAPPSTAHPEGSAALDQVLLRCLAADPAARFPSAADVKTAMQALIGHHEDGLDIDIDLDEKRRSRMPPAAAPSAAPQVGDRVSIHEDFRPSLMSAPPAPSAHVDLGNLVKKITENDAARWMAQKDGLDHGPFSGRELVGLIAKGEVLGDHVLLNMDTGERRKVREYPEFIEFVEQYKLKAHAQAEQAAIVQSAKTEKASNTAKGLIAFSVLGAVGLLVGVFFYTRGAEGSHEVSGAEMADLYDRGDVQIEGTAGILPDPPRGGGGHRRRSGGGGGGGAGTSYEDAMSEVVDIGSASGSGGEGRLSPSQVAGVMNGHINSFFPCVGTELRNGGSLGRVRIDIAIGGNGSVQGSSVRAGSAAFQSCVQHVVAGIHFPSFGAPRMGASYSFDASQ